MLVGKSNVALVMAAFIILYSLLGILSHDLGMNPGFGRLYFTYLLS